MGQNQKKIIAIGGGGFTHRSDEVLDKFVIDQCKKKQINFGFLPTASEDNKDKIKLFYSELDKYNIQLWKMTDAPCILYNISLQIIYRFWICKLQSRV